MNDPVVVERGEVWPHACVNCGSQGPGLLDYQTVKVGLYADTPNMPAEAGGYGRVYLCKLCVKAGARVYGFAKGKRLDELETAADQLAQKDKDIEGLLDRVASLTESVAERDRRISQHAARIDELERQKVTIAHLSGLIGTNVRQLADATA